MEWMVVLVPFVIGAAVRRYWVASAFVALGIVGFIWIAVGSEPNYAGEGGQNAGALIAVIGGCVAAALSIAGTWVAKRTRRTAERLSPTMRRIENRPEHLTRVRYAASAACLALLFASAAWTWPVGDPWHSIAFVGLLLLAGALIAQWWAVLLAVVVVAGFIALDHASGCTGSDGCETALVVFLGGPFVAALLLVGVTAGKLVRALSLRMRTRVDKPMAPPTLG